jgi:signal transduction histidine kinase
MMNKKKFTEPKVDKIEELTAQLLVANEKLKKEEQNRKMMLENISHDLRAPLTAIRTAVDYVKSLESDEILDKEEIHQMVQLIDKRTKTLEELIQDLYYLTCLDNDSSPFQTERIPIGDFLEDYYFTAEMDNKYEHRELQLDVNEGMNIEVDINMQQMTRVLDNLFTNALKYSNEGDEIKLGTYIPKIKEIQRHSNQESAASWVVVYVADTGIGIAPGNVEKVFDRTYMVSDARTPSGITSSGLGLAIVKTIVEKHGGMIWCESVMGKGSVFKAMLPGKNLRG